MGSQLTFIKKCKDILAPKMLAVYRTCMQMEKLPPPWAA